MARYLRMFWGILAFLTVLWMGSSLARIGTVAKQIDGQTVDARSESASDLGIAIGSGISFTIVFGCGTPALLLFLFMYWRNGVKIREDRKHQETLAAIQASQQ